MFLQFKGPSLVPVNVKDHWSEPAIIYFKNNRKSGFACIVLLSDVLDRINGVAVVARVKAR